MGYDMRMMTIPEGEAERVASAWTILKAANNIRTSIPQEERGQLTVEELASEVWISANASPRYRAISKIIDGSRELLEAENGSYFRLSVWGMSCYVDIMCRLGMVYGSESPNWPDYPTFGDERRDEQFVEATEYVEGNTTQLDASIPTDIRDAAHAYVEHATRIRRDHPTGGNTIPIHKFGSNDGWIVTPEEIAAALAVYDAHPDRNTILAEGFDEDGLDYWNRWISYLRLAADHHGFAVH